MPYPLDHAVISVRDRMDEAAAIYARMGFTLTKRGFHAAGSCNHLMVFKRDYLELIGMPPPGRKVRPDLLDAPVGLDGLVLVAEDPHALHDRLRARGLPIGEPQLLTRNADMPHGVEEARFTTVRFPRGAVSGGRLYFCKHETPHLVWHPAFQTHGNGAIGIARFTIAVADPAREAAQYERILDTAARRAGDSALLDLGHATLELVAPPALRARLGALACDPVDANGQPREAYMAMITIGVRDRGLAERVLRAADFSVATLDRDTIAVPAGEAMNCTIGFTISGLP
jgi:hypothetical protein